MLDIENKVQSILISSLNKKIYSGAAVGVSRYIGEGIYNRSITYTGCTEAWQYRFPVNKKTIFDLASLTKPLSTVLSLLQLISEGKIEWNETLDSLLSKKVDQDKEGITLSHLLSHSSGLPAYKAYYKKVTKSNFNQAKKKINRWILQEDLENSPGKRQIYSDLGFILLGTIIEEKTGGSLAQFWQQKIATPLRVKKRLHFLPSDMIEADECVATVNRYKYRQKKVGLVHDENCRAMGGVSGHAGLFGTCEGVLSLCEKIMTQYGNPAECDVVKNATLRKALKKENDCRWAAGFDTPSLFNSLAGDYFSANSFGHLGFTGTSFWMDMEREVVIVLLTNRVHMGTSREVINQLRREIHNCIMREIV